MKKRQTNWEKLDGNEEEPAAKNSDPLFIGRRGFLLGFEIGETSEEKFGVRVIKLLILLVTK